MTFHEMSDTALVIGIGRLQQEAVEELYRRHGGPLLSLAQRVLKEREIAEELVQDTFLILWRNPEQYDPDRSSLRSFLMAQTHIRAVEIVRSSIPRPGHDEPEGMAVTGGEVLEDEVLDVPVSERVRAALRRLSPAEEKVIALAYFGAHTYREIAELLDETEHAVKSRINSGLGKIGIGLDTPGAGPS